MSRIREFHLETLTLPLKQDFATSKDAAPRTRTRICRLTLYADTGHYGVGECVAVPYVTGETHEETVEHLGAVGRRLIGQPAMRRHSILAALAPHLTERPAVRAAVEMGLWDLWAQATGQSWWHLFGGNVAEVETDITLPMVDDVAGRARAYAAAGFRIFKVKVGRADLDADLALLQAVKDTVPSAVFRLDANQAYTPRQALTLLKEARSAGVHVELMEQPVDRQDLEGLDKVARESPVPVLADEAVLTPAEALKVVSETAVHGINVKLMKSGISGALDIIGIVRAAGRRLMMGCMLETPRGIGFALSLAAGTGAFQYYDLDGHMLTGMEPEPFFYQDGMRLRINQR